MIGKERKNKISLLILVMLFGVKYSVFSQEIKGTYENFRVYKGIDSIVILNDFQLHIYVRNKPGVSQAPIEATYKRCKKWLYLDFDFLDIIVDTIDCNSKSPYIELDASFTYFENATINGKTLHFESYPFIIPLNFIEKEPNQDNQIIKFEDKINNLNFKEELSINPNFCYLFSFKIYYKPYDYARLNKIKILGKNKIRMDVFKFRRK